MKVRTIRILAKAAAAIAFGWTAVSAALIVGDKPEPATPLTWWEAVQVLLSVLTIYFVGYWLGRTKITEDIERAEKMGSHFGPSADIEMLVDNEPVLLKAKPEPAVTGKSLSKRMTATKQKTLPAKKKAATKKK